MQNLPPSAPARGLLALVLMASPALAQDAAVSAAPQTPTSQEVTTPEGILRPVRREAAPAGRLPTIPSPLADGVSADARVTAVALNYCRAALHRIRRQPTPEVLSEERDRILDNLNLSGIADAEVIALYSALLEEISGVHLTRADRKLTSGHHSRSIRRKAVWDVLAFSTQLATAQFTSAVRTGADSWWDMRDMAYRRDTDLLQIERKRLDAVVDKSQMFLDTFWRLARKRQIPDAWLVRGQDLDRLARANTETDPSVRLRRLRRLEAYLVAYPPYWYHLARTQQELGDYAAAVQTYTSLEALEAGHFRVDEMLAASLANRALLEDELGMATAGATARRALAAAPDVWQANLAAARVLQRGGQLAMAEEAILRNVDSGLELATSQTFRLGLYYHSGDDEKLRAALADVEVVRHAAAPAVIRCLTRLEPHEQPQVAMAELSRSLAAYPRLTFGSDELVLAADDRWRLGTAGWSFPVLARGNTRPELRTVRGGHQARFSGPFEWGNPLRTTETLEVDVVLTYPDATRVSLTLREVPGAYVAARPTAGQRSMPSRITQRTVLSIASVRSDGTLVSFENAQPVRAAELPRDFAIE